MVLTPEFTKLLAERTGQSGATASTAVQAIVTQVGGTPSKTFRPPDWLGWSLISLGTVFILHSMAMKKPGS